MNDPTTPLARLRRDYDLSTEAVRDPSAYMYVRRDDVRAVVDRLELLEAALDLLRVVETSLNDLAKPDKIEAELGESDE